MSFLFLSHLFRVFDKTTSYKHPLFPQHQSEVPKLPHSADYKIHLNLKKKKFRKIFRQSFSIWGARDCFNRDTNLLSKFHFKTKQKKSNLCQKQPSESSLGLVALPSATTLRGRASIFLILSSRSSKRPLSHLLLQLQLHFLEKTLIKVFFKSRCSSNTNLLTRTS